MTVTRKHIWQAAGHKTRTQFTLWQTGKDRLPGGRHGATLQDDQNFRRILALPPLEFVELLRKRTII